MEETTLNAQTEQTGVENESVAGVQESLETQEGPHVTGQETQEGKETGKIETETGKVDERAFAARLRQEREKWEKENGDKIKFAKELEAAGYDLNTLQQELKKKDIDEMIAQGWDPEIAKEVVESRSRAERAERAAEMARLEAEGARLSRKYQDFDMDSTMAFAKQRANETGEAITLETAYLLMSYENARRAGEQSALKSLKNAQEKSTETGTKGGAKKSIEDMTDAEIEALNERVLSGEKVKL